MKNKSILFWLCFLPILNVIFFSCRNNEELQIIQNKYNSLNTNLFLSSDDAKALKHFSFLNYQKDSDFSKDYQTQMYQDSLKVLFPVSNGPLIYNFFAFGDSTNYTTRIFVEPGDSLHLAIKNKHISFSGRKADEQNFFVLLDSTETEWVKNKFVGDLKQYKEKCDSIYNRRRLFFEAYIKNNKVSSDFVRIVGTELKYEYLYNLISPRTASNGIGLNVNEDGGVLRVLSEDSKKSKEDFYDLFEYFRGVSIEDFKDSYMINNDYFRRSLTNYIRYFFTNSKDLQYSTLAFENEKKFIEENLDGELHNYAIYKLIADYYLNGFGNGELDRKNLQELLKIQKDELSNTRYYNALIEIEQELELLNFTFLDSIRNEKLILLNGDSLSIHKAFNKVNSKIKVLDFWASWCSPCIAEMKTAHSFKKKISKKYDVQWIYLSIDNSRDKWLKSSKDINEFIDSEIQYLLSEGTNSTLIKTLKVNTIPRYVILDRNNKVLIFNSSRPSDSIAFKKTIENLIESQ